MKLNQVRKALFTWLVLALCSGAAVAQQSRSMLDGDVSAAESSFVEIVLSSSGEVLQVRVEGCEHCRQNSYLPAREFEVLRADQLIDVRRMEEINGRPGTLVISTETGMVQKVVFSVPRGEEGGKQ